MVERILELAAKRAEGAEVVLEESESRPIQFENNQLKYGDAAIDLSHESVKFKKGQRTNG